MQVPPPLPLLLPMLQGMQKLPSSVVLLLAAGISALLISSGFLNQMTGGAISRAQAPVLQESPETLLAPRWVPAAVLTGGAPPAPYLVVPGSDQPAFGGVFVRS